ncbi:MAG TPA: protein kinase [Gemmatimonadales bacterium]|nr:protein kinase [Gemmatimonadales bacterium]
MTTAPERLVNALADRYVLERELGRGGMATVYLAQDLRHARRVAVKVLRPELAAIIGAERFLAEIRTTANLQHPHILPLHDSGEAGTFLYYVMPFIDGESLRDRLLREKQLPVDEAVRLATEVASALDYAHRHGVIHRDIKPENILVHDGRALVADFGIALAVSRAGDNRMTETGMSLGTPHYMSPEQATGEREITPRSDVYALGAVVYELLTGEPPFTGPTAQAIVAKLLIDQPSSVRQHRRTVPPHVDDAVLTALEKLPADRFANAADFSRALVGEEQGISRARTTGHGARSARRPGGAMVGFALAALALAMLGFLLLRQGRHSTPRPQVVRYTVEIPAPYRLATAIPAPVFSPDGRLLVLQATANSVRQLFLLRLAEGRITQIKSALDARSPAFSPDGRWLAYFGGGRLWKQAVDGGSPIALTDADGLGIAWADEQTIIFNRKYNTGLWRISASGGTPDTVTLPRTDAELGHWWPEVIPGPHPMVLFTAYGALGDANLSAASLETGERTELLRGAVYARQVPGNRLMYFRDGNILSVGFDRERVRIHGAPVPVLQHVAVDRLTSMPLFSASESGHLAFVPDTEYRAPRKLLWLDAAGTATDVVPDLGLYEYPRLSPDGRKIALTIDGESPDIWVLDIATGIRTRLTRTPTIEQRPFWTPDGRTIVYQREHGAFDVFARTADASDTATLVYSTRFDKYPYSMTPDGRYLAVMEDSLTERLLLVALKDSAAARTFGAGPFNQESPMFSPDGRWLAYVSNESGSYQLYVAGFDGAPSNPRILTRSGVTPGADYAWIRWSRSGRDIYYVSADSLVRVPFDPVSGVAGAPALVMRSSDEIADVSVDGRRFLAVRTPTETAPRRVQIVLNWFEELRDSTLR